MNIGVFFGSGSVEHDISIITANLIINGLKGLGYSVTPVYITKQGKWMLGEELGDLKYLTSRIVTPSPQPSPSGGEGEKYSEYYLDMQESVGKMVFKKKGILGKSITIDLAFPALHGTYGEDGTIQGLFEMFGLPYVGCGVPASAISMDKALSKIVMKDAGIPTTKFVTLLKVDWEKNRELQKERIRTLQYPLFVKPVHLGSSIGIGKAKDQKELEQKIEVALYYDHKVIVEEAVENLMDVTCCVIGNNSPRASLLQESVYTEDLFNFEDKYITDGGSQTGKAQNKLVIPARLDPELTKQIQETALKVYKAVECTGIARVDFLVNKQTKMFYANEINPLPGTLYHHLWKASGIELDELLKLLIGFAEENYKEKRSVNFSFESSVLKGIGGSKGKLQ
jgi:D-alanine-D-alanine ligase